MLSQERCPTKHLTQPAPYQIRDLNFRGLGNDLEFGSRSLKFVACASFFLLQY
jgi:hypothetical protein